MAQIGQDVEIGPFCVIEPDVTIADGCRLESRVVLKNGTVLGPNNWIFDGAVIGGMPQHAHMPERAGKVIIGSGNVIRENVTIHRALEADDATLIGDNNLLMVNVHVAHDCRVGNNIIFANNAMLAGHVTVGDRANVSGRSRPSILPDRLDGMVGGQSHRQDVPPYITVDGLSSYAVGINQIGLRAPGSARPTSGS